MITPNFKVDVFYRDKSGRLELGAVLHRREDLQTARVCARELIHAIKMEGHIKAEAIFLKKELKKILFYRGKLKKELNQIYQDMDE